MMRIFYCVEDEMYCICFNKDFDVILFDRFIVFIECWCEFDFSG